MSLVITTNEPNSVKNLFSDCVEVPMNFDMMLYTKNGPIPMERKHVPGDLLNSITDGRLNREISAMREISPVNIIILHGRIRFSIDGFIADKYLNRWNRRGVVNLLRTLEYVEGVYLEKAETDSELVSLIGELQEYFDKTHLSLRRRGGIQTDWLQPSRQEKVMHFYQGIPGISATRAKHLYQLYKNPIGLFQASLVDLTQVDDFGKGMSSHVYNFLRNGCTRGHCGICHKGV